MNFGSQTVTIAAVVIGALTTYLVTALGDRARERREMARQWVGSPARVDRRRPARAGRCRRLEPELAALPGGGRRVPPQRQAGTRGSRRVAAARRVGAPVPTRARRSRRIIRHHLRWRGKYGRP